jgi:DNA-directed RNA polymerase specialized sigma24 family protein
MERIIKDEIDLPNSLDAALYDRYGSAVFAYLRLKGASWENAEDLTLEVFIAALERDNLRGLDEKAQLAWLQRVAHNKLIDSYRRSTHRPLVSLHNIEEPRLSFTQPMVENLAGNRAQALWPESWPVDFCQCTCWLVVFYA